MISWQDSFGNGDAKSMAENGFSHLTSLAQSEKAVQELLLQQTPMQATDDHLIEFSEALRSKQAFNMCNMSSLDMGFNLNFLGYCSCCKGTKGSC